MKVDGLFLKIQGLTPASIDITLSNGETLDVIELKTNGIISLSGTGLPAACTAALNLKQ